MWQYDTLVFAVFYTSDTIVIVTSVFKTAVFKKYKCTDKREIISWRYLYVLEKFSLNKMPAVVDMRYTFKVQHDHIRLTHFKGNRTKSPRTGEFCPGGLCPGGLYPGFYFKSLATHLFHQRIEADAADVQGYILLQAYNFLSLSIRNRDRFRPLDRSSYM